MDKEELQRFSKPVADVYLAIEDQLLVNIAKKIARDNDILVDIEENGDIRKIESWQLKKLNDLDALTQEHIKIISKQSGKTAEEVEKMLSGAGYKAVNDIEGDMKNAADKGKLTMPEVKPKDSSALKDVLRGYEQQAKNKLNLTNTTMIDMSNQKYLNVINETTGKVLAGATSAQQALRESIRGLAEQGVPALVDKSGRQWSTEAYVNMVMRSTTNNVANSMQETRMDEYGVDLVEISAHDGARPLCEPYQGRVYSRSGNSDKYPPLSDTSYGEPAGIAGVNCGHIFNVYIEGTERTYKPVDRKTNEKVYEQSQKQRYLERQIRHAKREEMMFDALGDKDGAKDARRKMLDRQANMRDFIGETDRTRRREREQIHG